MPFVDDEDEFDFDSYYDNGVPYKKSWSYEKLRMYCLASKDGWVRGWFPQVYDYETARRESQEQAMYYINQQDSDNATTFSELDETLWVTITDILEEHRVFAMETFQDYGLNKCESHFLAVRILAAGISKFRLQMFIEFGGQDRKADYRRTALRNAINYLWRKLNELNVDRKYLWSREAADVRVGEFKNEVSRSIQKELMDTGAIFFAKITI